jgi:hypothetical protein
VASTIWSAVILVPSSTASSCRPVKRARPSINVTSPDSARLRRPAAEISPVLLKARSLMAGQSTPVSLASLPNSGV